MVCAQEGSGTGEPPSHGSQSRQVAVSSEAKGSTSTENQLLTSLRVAFRNENPKLAQVGVLDLKAWDTLGPRIVLGWAIVPDHVFRGNFSDEMFGVFVVNDSLNRIERVLGTFPTRSWRDYEVRFGKLTADSIEVLGESDTYGDDPTRHAYKWW